jgi:hypothetical protein
MKVDAVDRASQEQQDEGGHSKCLRPLAEQV